jgi:hypothetical protein
MYKHYFTFVEWRSAFADGASHEDFVHGFWINEDQKLTKGSDARQWIPPSQIQIIEKIYTHDEQKED